MRKLILGLFFALIPALAHATDGRENPFAEACIGTEVLKDRPATGLLTRTYPRIDANGVEARPFLEVVLNLALEKLEKDLIFVRNIEKCHSPEFQNNALCDDLRDFVGTLLPQLLRDARFHLSLAQSPKSLISSFEQTNGVPNQYLSAAGTTRLRPWQKLDAQEFQRAKQILKNYKTEIIDHYKSIWKIEKYTGRYQQRKVIMGSFLKTRLDHFDQYRLMVASAPFMQYFESPSVSTQEAITRFGEFKTNALAEQEYLQGLLRKLQGTPSDSDFDLILATTLQYSSYVEFVLKNNPEYCGLATSLTYTQFNRGLGTMLMVGFPLAAASFVMPALIVYPAGIIAGGYFTYDAYNQYDRAQTRAASVLMIDPGSNTDEMLWEAQNQVVTEVVLFPLSFIGGRMAIKGMRSFATGTVHSLPQMRGNLYIHSALEKIVQKFSRPL